jgi:hypothetical protein
VTPRPKPNLHMAVAFIASAVLFSACASDGPRGQRGGGPGGERGMREAGGRPGMMDFNALYRRTLEQTATGNCDSTLAPLETLSRQGPGYEGAQQALGACLLKTADITRQLEGLMWLRRAAEGGRAEAQGALAVVYLSGPQTLQDHDQALFWFALYRDTARRGRLGFVALTMEDDALLSNVFDDADLTTVATDVALWQPAPWIPPKSDDGGMSGGFGETFDDRPEEESRQRPPQGRRSTPAPADSI